MYASYCSFPVLCDTLTHVSSLVMSPVLCKDGYRNTVSFNEPDIGTDPCGYLDGPCSVSYLKVHGKHMKSINILSHVDARLWYMCPK